MVKGIIRRNEFGANSYEEWNGTFRAQEEIFDCSKIIIVDFIEHHEFQPHDLTSDREDAETTMHDKIYESYDEYDPSSDDAQYWIAKFKGIGQYNADNQFDEFPEHRTDRYYDHKQIFGVSKSGERFRIWDQYSIINRFDPNKVNTNINEKYGYWEP